MSSKRPKFNSKKNSLEGRNFDCTYCIPDIMEEAWAVACVLMGRIDLAVVAYVEVISAFRDVTEEAEAPACGAEE